MHGLPISVLILITVAVVMTVVATQDPPWPLYLCRRRQPRCGGAFGHQHPRADGEDLRADGLSVRPGGADRPGPPAKPRQRHRDAGRTARHRRCGDRRHGAGGGVGTIYGAVLGALIMQSLQSGMAMVGVDTPFQNIVVGLVLIIAVWVDILYRKRLGLSK